VGFEDEYVSGHGSNDWRACPAERWLLSTIANLQFA
jgi:hypothetical protein